MLIRSRGFFRDDDPQGSQPRDSTVLAILVLIVSAVVGSSGIVLAWALFFTAGR